MNNFSAVRMAYYKHQNGKKVIGHIERTNKNNVNIVDRTLTKENFGTSGSIEKRYEKTRQKHTQLKGKRPRSDFNAIVEHVVILSEKQAQAILGDRDHGKKSLNKAMSVYVRSVKEEFGFEPLGWRFHLDEGHINEETGEIKRNIHAQAIFYNYDFKNQSSPLRKMQKKGIDPDTGRTRTLNPHFERLQDLVALAFKPLGFRRGISRGKENRKNLRKIEFIKFKLEEEIKNLNANRERSQRIVIAEKADLENIEKAKEKKQKEICDLKENYAKILSTRAVMRFVRACQKYEKATRINDERKRKAAIKRSENAREKAAEEIKRKKEFLEMERRRWTPEESVSLEQREFLDQINQASASRVDLSKIKIRRKSG